MGEKRGLIFTRTDQIFLKVGVLDGSPIRRRRRLTTDDDGYDDEDLLCDAGGDARDVPRGTLYDEDAKRDA